MKHKTLKTFAAGVAALALAWVGMAFAAQRTVLSLPSATDKDTHCTMPGGAAREGTGSTMPGGRSALAAPVPATVEEREFDCGGERVKCWFTYPTNAQSHCVAVVGFAGFGKRHQAPRREAYNCKMFVTADVASPEASKLLFPQVLEAVKTHPKWNRRDILLNCDRGGALVGIWAAASDPCVTELGMDFPLMRLPGAPDGDPWNAVECARKITSICRVAIYRLSLDENDKPAGDNAAFVAALTCPCSVSWRHKGNPGKKAVFFEQKGGRATGPWPKLPVIAADQARASYVIFDAAEGAPPHFVWEWSAQGDDGIAAKDKALFDYPSECKVRDGGRKLLVNASAGGIALIDMATRKAEWYGHVTGNPHSVELLPDGKVIVASSDNGDKLVLFDVTKHPFDLAKQDTKTVWKLRSAHGVVWDAPRDSLWALGKTNLIQFAYNRAEGSLTRRAEWDLQKEGLYDGHDLSADGRGGYYFSTRERISHFDPETGRFSVARERVNVKSFDTNAANGDIFAIPNDRWYTDRVTISKDGRDRTFAIPGARFYKARWFPASKPF